MRRIAPILATLIAAGALALPTGPAIACSRPPGPPGPPDLTRWVAQADRIYAGLILDERPVPGAPAPPIPTGTPDESRLPSHLRPDPIAIAGYQAATATAEAALPRPPTATSDPYRAPEDSTPSVPGLNNHSWPYVSTVQPVAVLRGPAPSGAFDVAYLGTENSDCTGGPRLQQGERVILLLRSSHPAAPRGAWDPGLSWNSAIVLNGDVALQRSRGRRVPLGEAGEVAREVALLAGAPDDQLERLERFARGMDLDPLRATPVSPQVVAGVADSGRTAGRGTGPAQADNALGSPPPPLPAPAPPGPVAIRSFAGETGLIGLVLIGGLAAVAVCFRVRARPRE